MINKPISVIVSLLFILVLPAWLGCQCSRTSTSETSVLSPITDLLATEPDAEDIPVKGVPANTTNTTHNKNVAIEPLPRPALNLDIPEENFLMHTTVEIPQDENWLKNLFNPPAKRKHVKVGGGLILDEKPADPNAAVWDQVKGAEVDVTIETR